MTIRTKVGALALGQLSFGGPERGTWAICARMGGKM